ncbi:MAG: RNA-binding S4 domain-containing protein [Bacteroidota bacterium]
MEFELKSDSDYIELIKLLKALNIAETGAQAKAMVEEGLVQLNSTQENRKRAKVKRGDEVRIFDYVVTVK